MIGLLNQELADTTDLYSQTKQAHWNVKGIHFYQLHLLFDQLAEKRQGEADELAERATELGGYALGTVRMAAASSRLPEIPIDINAGVDYVRALVERYGIHANSHASRDRRGRRGRRQGHRGPLHRDLPGSRQRPLVPPGPSARARTSRSPACAGVRRYRCPAGPMPSPRI